MLIVAPRLIAVEMAECKRYAAGTTVRTGEQRGAA